jgi:hypothetical protein
VPTDAGHEVVAKQRNAEAPHVFQHVPVAFDIGFASGQSELDAIHVELVALQPGQRESPLGKAFVDDTQRLEIIGRLEPGEIRRALADGVTHADLRGEIPELVRNGGKELGNFHLE